MDRRVIEEKLESLRRCARRIEAKRPEQVEALRDNVDLQDILTLNITRAVQLCVDIAAHIVAASETYPPETMAETFDTLVTLDVIEPALAGRMKKAVGFRNVAVHNYKAIAWEVVYAICHKNLDDFSDFARAVMRAVEKRGNIDESSI